MSAQRSASGGSARLSHRGGQLASPRLDFLAHEAGASLWTLPSPGHCQGMTTSGKGVSSGDAWPFANHALPQLGVMLSADGGDQGHRTTRQPEQAAAGFPGCLRRVGHLYTHNTRESPRSSPSLSPFTDDDPGTRSDPGPHPGPRGKRPGRPPHGLLSSPAKEPSDPAPEPSPGCGRHPAVQGCGRHPRIRGRGLETPAAPYPNCWPPSREGAGAGRRRPRAPWAARPRSKCERL